MNRHHNQGKSYTKQHLTGAGLQVQRFSPLSSQAGAWQHPGRHGEGGAESSTSSYEGCKQNTGFQAARMRVLKPIPTVPRLLQKATPSDSATPWVKHIQTTTDYIII